MVTKLTKRLQSQKYIFFQNFITNLKLLRPSSPQNPNINFLRTLKFVVALVKKDFQYRVSRLTIQPLISIERKNLDYIR